MHKDSSYVMLGIKYWLKRGKLYFPKIFVPWCQNLQKMFCKVPKHSFWMNFQLKCWKKLQFILLKIDTMIIRRIYSRFKRESSLPCFEFYKGSHRKKVNIFFKYWIFVLHHYRYLSRGYYTILSYERTKKYLFLALSEPETKLIDQHIRYV